MPSASGRWGQEGNNVGPEFEVWQSRGSKFRSPESQSPAEWPDSREARFQCRVFRNFKSASPRSSPQICLSQIQSSNLLLPDPVLKSASPRSRPQICLSQIQSSNLLVPDPVLKSACPRSRPQICLSQIQSSNLLVPDPVLKSPLRGIMTHVSL